MLEAQRNGEEIDADSSDEEQNPNELSEEQAIKLAT